jgi:hypothetical protein
MVLRPHGAVLEWPAPCNLACRDGFFTLALCTISVGWRCSAGPRLLSWAGDAAAAGRGRCCRRCSPAGVHGGGAASARTAAVQYSRYYNTSNPWLGLDSKNAQYSPPVLLEQYVQGSPNYVGHPMRADIVIVPFYPIIYGLHPHI